MGQGQSMTSGTTSRDTAGKGPVGVDLSLPKHKKPADVNRFRAAWKPKCGNIQTHVDHLATIKDSGGLPPQFFGGSDGQTPAPYTAGKELKTYAIGSSSHQNDVYFDQDLGLFQCVQEAWKNHWNLRTSPDDWWFPVACHIAKAIDKSAKPSAFDNDVVRKLFVSHEGKEEIKIEVPVYSIYEVNYDELFACFSVELQNRIKIPEFATTMQNDFTTSSPSQQIASQVNLMASMQEFFDYHMVMCGCGIKGLELIGQKADWDRLVEKLRSARKLLAPISEQLEGQGVDESWFNHVEYVFYNLAESYDQPQSRKVAKFWADVIMVSKDWEYGPSGFGRHEVEAYNGWLIQFLTNRTSIHVKDLASSDSRLKSKLSGINEVPLKVSMTWCTPAITDEAQLVAGMMGFTLHGPNETFNQVPSLQPNHAWAMMLPPRSLLRRGESKF